MKKRRKTVNPVCVNEDGFIMHRSQFRLSHTEFLNTKDYSVTVLTGR